MLQWILLITVTNNAVVGIISFRVFFLFTLNNIFPYNVTWTLQLSKLTSHKNTWRAQRLSTQNNSPWHIPFWVLKNSWMLVDRRTGPVFEPGLAQTVAKFEISNNSAANLLNNKIKVFQPDKNTNDCRYLRVFIVKNLSSVFYKINGIMSLFWLIDWASKN